MTPKTLGLPDDLHAYVVAHGSAPDAIIGDLIDETLSTLPDEASMQIALEQAGFLTMLAKILDARHAVEVGTFTGLSSIAIARGLADGGRLTCFDVSTRYTAVARRYWAKAGLTDRIQLRIGPAVEGLRELSREPSIDLAFIDADKVSYPEYWAELVPRMRPGGVICVDNVLRHGRVLTPATAADRIVVEFNDMVIADDRVESVMLPIADGVTVARKR